MSRGVGFGFAKCAHEQCDKTAIISIPNQNVVVCNKHYQRFLRKGDWRIPDKKKQTICSVENCGEPVRSAYSDKCETHYYRMRRGSALGDGPIVDSCYVCGAQLRKKGAKTCGSKKCVSTHSRKKYNDLETRLRSWNSSYKLRAKNKGCEYEDVDLYSLCVEWNWICAICNKPINPIIRWPLIDALSIDHHHPIAAGGGHTRGNCRPVHFGCNIHKSAVSDSKIISKNKRVSIREVEFLERMLQKYDPETVEKRRKSREKRDLINKSRRERYKEKQALRELARKDTLQRYVTRGSELLKNGGADVERRSQGPDQQANDAIETGGHQVGSDITTAIRKANKAAQVTVKSRWPSRPFPSSQAKQRKSARQVAAEDRPDNESDQEA